ARGQLVRVVVEGDTIIELIGADIDTSIVPNLSDPSNVVLLGDLPGYIVQSDLGRVGSVNGGLGGEDGVTLRDDINLSGSPQGPAGNLNSPSDALNIQAIATSPDTGNTWGLNFLTLTPQGSDEEISIVQVIEFDAETGDGTI